MLSTIFVYVLIVSLLVILHLSAYCNHCVLNLWLLASLFTVFVTFIIYSTQFCNLIKVKLNGIKKLKSIFYRRQFCIHNTDQKLNERPFNTKNRCLFRKFKPPERY